MPVKKNTFTKRFRAEHARRLEILLVERAKLPATAKLTAEQREQLHELGFTQADIVEGLR